MSDSENEDTECYEMDEIEIKYFNHIEELKKIKIEGHCLLKKALIKYKMQTDTDSEREKYTYEDYCSRCSTDCAYYDRNWGNWLYFRYCEDILDLRGNEAQDMYVAKTD